MNFLFIKKKSNFLIFILTYILVFTCLYFIFDLSQLKYRYELNIELIKSDIEPFQKVEISELQNFDETNIKNQINKFINYFKNNSKNFYKKEITKQFKGNYILFRKDFISGKEGKNIGLEYISNFKIDHKVLINEINKLFVKNFYEQTVISHNGNLQKFEKFLKNNSKNNVVLFNEIDWINENYKTTKEYLDILNILYNDEYFEQILKKYIIYKTTIIEKNKLTKSLFYSFFISFFLLIIFSNFRKEKAYN